MICDRGARIQNAIRGLILASHAVFAACGAEQAPGQSSGSEESLDSGGLALEALAPGGVRSLEVYRDGDRLHLMYAVPDGTEGYAHVFHTSSADGGEAWSAGVRVDSPESRAFGASHTNAPQVAGHGENLVAVWTQNGNSFMGRGPLASATSHDGGKTWQAGPAPSPIPGKPGQAFVDLIGGEGDVLHLVWLGRNGKEGRGPKSLLYSTSIDIGASWSTPTTVDEAVCECCWNMLTREQEDGSIYVLYRDLDPRDMSVARFDPLASEWSHLGRAGVFDWDIQGCPHAGGGIAALGSGEDRTVHTVVWTGKSGEAGVYYVRSLDDGETWEDPVELAGVFGVHGDIVRSGGGEALFAAWAAYERKAGESFIFGIRSTDGGDTWTESLMISEPGREAKLPRIVEMQEGVRVFWLEPGLDSGAGLRTRLVRMEEFSQH